LIGFEQLRPDEQHAWAIRDRRLGLHSINCQIEYHLLQLDPIAAYKGQSRR